eukprot:jgi/Chrzof1/14904/Cz09g20050.t1
MSDPPTSLAEALFGKRTDDSVWQDRDIRFDIAPPELQCRGGEQVLHTVDSVEDTKGNNGDEGEVLVTNLRVMWIYKKRRRTNLSIGLNCITGSSVRTAASRLKGNTAALYLLTRWNNQRFEFIFTSLLDTTPQLLQCIQAVHSSYEASRLFRELKLRGAIIQQKELKLLPSEQAYSKVNGVWNLSSEQGNLGTFFITNVRVVWYSNMAEAFNVSIPYLQIKSVRVCESKFGTALVIETTARSGGYVLGFKIDPAETLEYVQKELNSLWQVYSNNPIFGVEYDASNSIQPEGAQATMAITPTEEDVQIVDANSKGDLWAAYYADGGKTAGREPVFCPELGVATEALKDGASTAQLWCVV